MATPESNRFCVSDLLSTATVQLRLAGRDRTEILIELVASIPELAHRPEGRQALLCALLEREELHSTGIGDGIALPHARTAPTGLVEHPVIVIGRHPAGIPYGAIDNRPVRLFFLLVTINVTQHLQVLARISRLLRDAALRQSLLTADRPERAVALVRQAESFT
jgi:mannitol/fructose-specific phosphotransferase system IIA component (Ntr-type)